MTDLVLADLTFRIPGSVVTTATYGFTNGLEYHGANAPRVYAPRMLEFVNLERHAVADGKTFGPTDTSPAVLRIANPDGLYDDWKSYGGAAAVFRLADSTTQDYDTTTVIATLRILRIEADFEEVRLHLEDRSAETDQDIQTDLYAGTNSGSTGVEGLPSDLKGKPRPDAFGYVFQVPLPWANESALILELDSQRIENIADGNVYDGLVGLTRGTSRANLAALQAGTPTAGTFDYYLGGSEDGAYIKLGSAPNYSITADIEGKAPSGTFLNTPAELFDWILQNRAGVAYTDISAADLTALATDAPYDLGIWLDTQTSVRAVLDLIAASLPGYWYVDALGVYHIKQLRDPSGETPIATFKVIEPTGIAKASDGDVVSIEKISTNDAGGGKPVKKVNVYYKRFYQITDFGFDTASTIALRSEAKNEWRIATASDSTVEDVHDDAATMDVYTALVDEADAQDVADLLLEIYSVPRDRFRLTVRIAAAISNDLELGDYISVEFPRFGMDSGKTFEVRGLRYRGADDEEIGDLAVLDIWG